MVAQFVFCSKDAN